MKVKDILSWLEKQGESYTKKDVDDAYLRGISDAKIELEKQGEQNPAEWSEDDETIAKALTKAANDNVLYGYIGKSKLLEWLKALKDRVQPRQEWSEEGNEQYERAIYMMEQLNMTESWDDVYNWLKSLKDRCTWKPSDEQMKALWEAYKGGEEQAALALLYSDLKKLKE